MPVSRVAALSAALSLAAACGSALPTAPSPSSGTRLALTCSPSTLFAGDYVICLATVGSVNVNISAAWTSSDPNVATSLDHGAFIGKAEGQATLTSTYSGQSLSAAVTVHLQDILRATASAEQGSFKVGTVVTLWLQGFYGVASAASGTLTLLITDQSGATVSTSEPLIVQHGADRYLMSTTFTIPPGTTRVCRSGTLQIGSTTLTVVPDVALVPCFVVTP